MPKSRRLDFKLSKADEAFLHSQMAPPRGRGLEKRMAFSQPGGRLLRKNAGKRIGSFLKGVAKYGGIGASLLTGNPLFAMGGLALGGLGSRSRRKKHRRRMRTIRRQ